MQNKWKKINDNYMRKSPRSHELEIEPPESFQSFRVSLHKNNNNNGNFVYFSKSIENTNNIHIRNMKNSLRLVFINEQYHLTTVLIWMFDLFII